MVAIVNRRVVLASRPQGAPGVENFRVEDVAVPAIGAGQVLLKTLFLSLDPYMRGRMDAGMSYAAPVEIGGVMEGQTVGEVLASQNPAFAVGDVVLAHSGWQQFGVSDGAGLRKLDAKAAPVSTYLGVLGMPGFTAYGGMLNISKPKPGETLVVAAAAGPVGATVGQMARMAGARAVGIAGGAEKCAYLLEELGFDAAIDHRSAKFAEELGAACSNGVDIYFENVGGPVLDAVLPLLNDFARVPVCGTIAYYNGTTSYGGMDRLPGVMRRILVKSLTVRGFINKEFMEQYPAFERDMTKWIADGTIKYREDVSEGIDSAPETFIGMLRGRNFGKALVKVAA